MGWSLISRSLDMHTLHARGEGEIQLSHHLFMFSVQRGTWEDRGPALKSCLLCDVSWKSFFLAQELM